MVVSFENRFVFPTRKSSYSSLNQQEGQACCVTVQGTQPAGPLDVPRLAGFLAHTTKTGHSMHGIHLGMKELHRRQFMHSSYRHC